MLKKQEQELRKEKKNPKSQNNVGREQEDG